LFYDEIRHLVSHQQVNDSFNKSLVFLNRCTDCYQQNKEQLVFMLKMFSSPDGQAINYLLQKKILES
jgi:hypothetical protein